MANYEQLFLLEVLVDRLKLLTRALAAFAPETEDEPDTPIRIRVKFSDFPCFEITQDLAPPDRERSNSDLLTTPIIFNSGKSCMFPMDPAQLLQDLIKYPMAVTIFKKNPEHPLPDIIGQTKVPLGEYMTNIIKRAAEWSLEEPLSELIQDTFPLRNAQDQDVGTINMLIRMTCFGKTIITKFQIADNKKSFLFKNAKVQDYEFKCKKCMPGQPILRPQPKESNGFEEEEEENWNQEGMNGGGEPDEPCFEKEDEPTRPSSNRETYSQGPGFQRHEIQGPGFTASMEVRYPENAESTYDSGYNYNGPTESQSTPTVKKAEKGEKDRRGKSLDSKKVEIKNGVSLNKPKRKRRSKFHIMPQIAYPGVILGHKYCLNQGPPVPARNGWAWKTTVPYGMKWEDRRGWRPGAYLKQTWATIKEVEELRKMGKRKRVKRNPTLPDMRKTTVHIHRIKGLYHVTMNPIQGPDDKKPPEPIVYTLENPEDGSDASELELDLTVPDPPYPPPPKLKHQAQQFCEEDLPLILPKQVFIKKKKKKKPPKTPVIETKKKKRKPSSGRSSTSDGKGSRSSGKGGKGGKDEKDKAGAKGGKAGEKAQHEKGGKGEKTQPEKGGKGGKGEKSQPEKGGKGGKGEKAQPEKGGKGGKGEKAQPEKGGKGGKGEKAQPEKGGKGGKGEKAPSEKGGKGGKDRPVSAGKGKGGKKGKKKGDDEDDVYPWDEWIMKLKCKNKHSPED